MRCWEDMYAMNWEAAAACGGKITPIVCLVTAILGFVIKAQIGIQVYTFFISFFVAFFELPWLFACIGPCHRAQDKLNKEWGFDKGVVRFIMYVLFSIITFIKPSISILAGVVLLIEAILYLFAWYFVDTGVAETRTTSGRRTSQQGSNAIPYTPHANQDDNGFGTF